MVSLVAACWTGLITPGAVPTSRGQLLQHVLCMYCVRTYFDRASGDNTGRKDQPRSFMPPIRINLVHGTGVDPAKCHKCVVDTVVVVEPEHAAIAKVALNKLRRLKSKSLERVQLVLRSAVREHPAGTVLPNDGSPLIKYLCNDATVAVNIIPAPDHSASRKKEEVEVPGTSAAAAAQQWREAALASSKVADAPSDMSASDAIAQPDILYLIASKMGLRNFLSRAAVCRAWNAAAQCDDCASVDDWRWLCSCKSPLLPFLKHPTVDWNTLLRRHMATCRDAWQREEEYELLVHVYALHGQLAFQASVPLNGQVINKLCNGETVLVEDAGLVAGATSAKWARVALLMVLHVLRLTDGALCQVSGYMQSPPTIEGGVRRRFVEDPSMPGSSQVWRGQAGPSLPSRDSIVDLLLQPPSAPDASLLPQTSSLVSPDVVDAGDGTRAKVEIGVRAAASLEVRHLPFGNYWELEELNFKPDDKLIRCTDALHSALMDEASTGAADSLLQAWRQPSVRRALFDALPELLTQANIFEDFIRNLLSSATVIAQLQ